MRRSSWSAAMFRSDRSIRNRFGLLGVSAVLWLAVAAHVRAAEPVGKKYAVLIGIDRYNHDSFTKLTYAENVVAALAAVLRVAGYEVTLLPGAEGAKDAERQPPHANIENRLTAVLDRAGPADLVL